MNTDNILTLCPRCHDNESWSMAEDAVVTFRLEPDGECGEMLDLSSPDGGEPWKLYQCLGCGFETKVSPIGAEVEALVEFVSEEE
jgi:hypothetical protein